MILGEKELAWQAKVVAAAIAHGWVVYPFTNRKAPQALPGLIMLRGYRMLAVYLRTRVRADRAPDIRAFTDATGVQAVIWSPDRWAEIVLELDGLAPATATKAAAGDVAR